MIWPKQNTLNLHLHLLFCWSWNDSQYCGCDIIKCLMLKNLDVLVNVCFINSFETLPCLAILMNHGSFNIKIERHDDWFSRRTSNLIQWTLKKIFWQLQTLNYRVSAFHLQNKAIRAKHADIRLSFITMTECQSIWHPI